MDSLKHALFFSFLVVATIAMSDASSSSVRGGYYPDWATDYPPSSINTTLLTHIFYAFLLPNNATFGFNVSDLDAKNYVNFTSTLHGKRPPAKALISIGGGGNDPNFYAKMASQASTRKIFIDSAIKVARVYGFDGLDLDWEFPTNQVEMDDLGQLFKEWRAAITVEARSSRRSPLLLTAAVYFSVDFFLDSTNRRYPVAEINQNLDWINVMCYDYHGSWDTTATGAPAALYDPTSNISTSYGLTSWVNGGLLRHKVVMGLPLYGRTWKLKDESNHGIGAPSIGVGPGEDGVLTFTQVESFNTENNATVVYDEETVSTYSYAGTSWVGYDDVRSTNGKVKYARTLDLGGYFFWAISYDPQSEITSAASLTWRSLKINNKGHSLRGSHTFG